MCMFFADEAPQEILDSVDMETIKHMSTSRAKNKRLADSFIRVPYKKVIGLPIETLDGPPEHTVWSKHSKQFEQHIIEKL